MTRLYAEGDRAAALAGLSEWPEQRIKKHLDALSDSVVSVRKCPSCPTRMAFSRFPIRAALLLHAELEIQQQFAPPLSEQLSQCGMGLHSTAIEHLAAILQLLDPQAGDFLKPFYLALAHQAQWSHCFTQSQLWARAGLKRFPKAELLLMALGVATETGAFFTVAPAPRTLDMPASAARERDTRAVQIRDAWNDARQAFEDALAASPKLHEARLRLGRVLWRLGKPEPARAALEGVLADFADARLQYLAHLFLGRVLEDAGQRADAETHYRAALAMQPRSPVAAVAVSHIRFLQGDPDSAREILRAGMETARRRTALDPWMTHLITQTPDGETIFAELRRGLQP